MITGRGWSIDNKSKETREWIKVLILKMGIKPLGLANSIKGQIVNILPFDAIWFL